MRALLWPLFAWSARAQPATLEEGTTEDGGALASDRSVGVVAGRYAMALVSTQLSSFGRSGFSDCFGWPVGKGLGLVSPLFIWSAWV